MDLRETEQQHDYRMKARAWLEVNAPRNWELVVENYTELAKVLTDWECSMAAAGYVGISVSKEYGGQGLTFMEEIIFNEEMGRAGAPRGINNIGRNLLVPTLLAVASEEQKKRYVPKVMSAEEIWCQGYSEPNAGSDLASLATKAVRDGDEWVINGQKVWTSFATEAQMCFVLARTDTSAPKHRGITYFLVPMNTPGITVRPLKQLNTKSDFCEVFFENVRIPANSHVGEINEGWKVANTTLTFERGSGALGRTAIYMKAFHDLLALTTDLEVPATGSKVIEDSHYRQRLAKSYIEFAILRYHGLNIASQIVNNQKIGPEASMQKLYYSEAHKRFGELAMDIEAHRANYWFDSGLANGKFQLSYLESRGDTIHSGTSQVQKNIIAERVLGMPR
ncbi:acyl-CoA dehydrogenase family protein [Hoeflea sp.]|uniref:acyl-CoA dehydrogenase family protein n=1 Tax=Hoeflea sp. TaxID=1940281 RepID=UPI003A91276A